MKKCLLLIGLGLVVGGGIYGWWWVQPIRQMSTLSQAEGPGPAWGSEEMYREYPQLSSVLDSLVEEFMDPSGDTVEANELVDRVYQVSYWRVVYGASLMTTGLLALFSSWGLGVMQSRVSGQVGQGTGELFSKNDSKSIQSG